MSYGIDLRSAARQAFERLDLEAQEVVLDQIEAFAASADLLPNRPLPLTLDHETRVETKRRRLRHLPSPGIRAAPQDDESSSASAFTVGRSSRERLCLRLPKRKPRRRHDIPPPAGRNRLSIRTNSRSVERRPRHVAPARGGKALAHVPRQRNLCASQGDVRPVLAPFRDKPDLAARVLNLPVEQDQPADVTADSRRDHADRSARREAFDVIHVQAHGLRERRSRTVLHKPLARPVREPRRGTSA